MDYRIQIDAALTAAEQALVRYEEARDGLRAAHLEQIECIKRKTEESPELVAKIQSLIWLEQDAISDQVRALKTVSMFRAFSRGIVPAVMP